jgi:hypothetical protein
MKQNIKQGKSGKLSKKTIDKTAQAVAAFNKTSPPKLPPEQPIKSLQFDLFGEFVANDKSKVSNTIEIWERIPKYFPTRSLNNLRPEKGHPDPYEWEYIEDNHKYTIVIQPALIKKNGLYKAYFPGVTEELIEEALKKILADQNYGVHDPENAETWVKFSLSMLSRELNARSCSRSRLEIKHAIAVMSGCIMHFYIDGEEFWKGAILQDLVTVGRKDYLSDSDVQHTARFPIFISHAINCLDYRQFNYDRLMKCNSPLSRWVYKKLIHKFTYANYITGNSHHFMYSDIKNSGLIQQARECDNRRKVKDALNELVSQKVLSKYEIDEHRKGREVINVKYTVFATSEFVTEQKAASKRKNTIETKSIDAGLKPVDKSGISRRFNSHK